MGRARPTGAVRSTGALADPWTAWPEGAAQLKNLTVSGFAAGVDSIVQDTGQKC